MRPWSGRRSKTNSLGGVEGESSTVEPHRPTFTEGPVTSHDAALFTGVPRRREILLTSPRIHRPLVYWEPDARDQKRKAWGKGARNLPLVTHFVTLSGR
jgi:hypothetical protein